MDGQRRVQKLVSADPDKSGWPPMSYQRNGGTPPSKKNKKTNTAFNDDSNKKIIRKNTNIIQK